MSDLSLDADGLTSLADLLTARGRHLATTAISCPGIDDGDVEAALADVLNIGMKQLRTAATLLTGQAVAARQAVSAYEYAEGVIVRQANDSRQAMAS